ncbi:MAG: chemotaxis response regulator protein-glutamate methylesterase [Nitrospirae bacterium]|nr:MAG: chemotaxis response regulator protein-glutamate methylesterase [Nitrospirota bacterium]
MKKTRVLVVDDSAFSRQTLRRMLDERADIEVTAVAFDGLDAIVKTLKYQPDMITLDLMMPNMDGFSFLRWLSTHRPIPVIVVSSLGDEKTLFRALEMGAMDFIVKPTNRASDKLNRIKEDLYKKIDSIKTASTLNLKRNIEHLKLARPAEKLTRRKKIFDAVLIGSSTGGPQAIQFILKNLPASFNLPILVSQHMPAGFTKTFAERLNSLVPFKVKEAEEAEPVLPGHVYISPGGRHMSLKRSGSSITIGLLPPSDDDKYTPSVDKLFESASEIYKNRAIGVILTGMGNDGLQGAKKLSDRGGYIIAESEESAVVFGMPREVIKAGLAKEIVKLEDIPSRIINLY